MQSVFVQKVNNSTSQCFLAKVGLINSRFAQRLDYSPNTYFCKTNIHTSSENCCFDFSPPPSSSEPLALRTTTALIRHKIPSNTPLMLPGSSTPSRSRNQVQKKKKDWCIALQQHFRKRKQTDLSRISHVLWQQPEPKGKQEIWQRISWHGKCDPRRVSISRTTATYARTLHLKHSKLIPRVTQGPWQSKYKSQKFSKKDDLLPFHSLPHQMLQLNSIRFCWDKGFFCRSKCLFTC